MWFLKQLSYSEPVIKIGCDAQNTTIGGIPGKIEAGEWTITVYYFAEHIERLLKDQSLTYQITVTDEDAQMKEAIAGPLWVSDSFCYDRYDYSKEYQSEKCWYKGDLHTHTRLSDGKELPKRANEKSQLMDLDYYIPTEHNVMHTGWPETEVCVVPGLEITTTQGHANLFGITHMPSALEDVIRHSAAEELNTDIQRVIDESRENVTAM